MNIKQVSEEKGISADTLRYYERIGLIPPVNRTNGGIRDYTEEDLRWVDFTLCMRSAGLSIESLTEYIRLYSAGDETILARRDLLMKESEQLAKKIAEMQACQERLQKKIARYNQDLVKGDPILV
ncbi:MerR family transcriptional regulator [Enterococcus mundtii]|uniref:MerR family transcriptional regulator n=1 Tax=Enterococcus TaxID=1350 RepID=UPI0007EEE071|nr:MerR family transcriptional regulator [Enterococcus mundtii]MBO1086387.1 MerR family transcriptional regulator [Enterococcus mundtii]MDV7744511.1 MerR family transcriptional regulator [Enterococcus mundtii]OBS61403.1 transcriptional regulator [Enterococcus mundtii]PQC32337.1 MerR family transcriptional regulator [Enterococcus mundtii]